jgi:hypothetical protein
MLSEGNLNKSDCNNKMLTSMQHNCSSNPNPNINKVIDDYLHKYDMLVKRDKLDTSLSSSFINFTNMNTIYEENILNINTNSSSPDNTSRDQQASIISLSSSSSSSSSQSSPLLLTPDSLAESEIENSRDDAKLETKVN